MTEDEKRIETFINSKNVIFVPVGIPLNYHENYDKDNHFNIVQIINVNKKSEQFIIE